MMVAGMQMTARPKSTKSSYRLGEDDLQRPPVVALNMSLSGLYIK